MNIVRYVDRPDLRARRFAELVGLTFPEYMNHNEPGDVYWDRLYTDFPDFQVGLVDGEELLAEAHAVPLPWDGTLDDLPSGWDEGFVRGMTSMRLRRRSWPSRSASRRLSRDGGSRVG